MREYSTSLDLGTDIKEVKPAKKEVIEPKPKKRAQKPEKRPSEAHPAIGKIKRYQIPIMLLILIILAFSLRVQTFKLPETDRLAEEHIHKNLAIQISNQINKDYAYLPEAQRLDMIKGEYSRQIDLPETQQAIKERSQTYKDFYRDDKGQTYLYGYDPYYYYRQAKNIIRRGGIGEIEKDGKQYDLLREAPSEMRIQPTLLPYIEAYTYRIMHVFNSNISLMKAVFYVPVIFGVLSVILIFFIAKKISNNLGGFIAAFLFAIHPQSFVVTFAGFTDTNSINLFFSLLIVWLFVEGIGFKNKVRSAVFLALIIPAALLFRFSWNNFYYIFGILAIYALAYLFTTNIKPALKKSKKSIAIASAVPVVAILFALFFIKSEYFPYIANIFRLKMPAAFFPGGLATVGELQRLPLGLFIHFMGGGILVVIAIASIIYLIYKNKNLKNIKYDLLVLIWFFSLVLLPLLAKRAMQYFVPVFCIVIGLGIAAFLPRFIKIVEAVHLRARKEIKVFFYVILVVILLTVPLVSRLGAAFTVLPAVDDSFYDTAEKIKFETSPDTIVTAWWDYGYFFQAISERRVTFDGGSFGSPRFYWVSKALLTDDEIVSTGIIRMLNCRGDQDAYQVIARKLGDVKAMEVLNKMVAQDKSEAEETLKSHNIDPSILSYTHCDSEAVLVLSRGLLSMVPNIKSFAEWDFLENEMYNSIEGLSQEEAAALLNQKYSLTEQQAAEVFFESKERYKKPVIEQPITSIFSCIEGEKVLCENNIEFFNMTASVGRKHPNKLILVNGTDIKTKSYEDRTDFDLIMLENEKGFRAFVVKPWLSDTILFRLLVLNGYGLENFELFSDVSEELTTRVIAWKVKI